ncbi:putative RAD50 DNA repair protein [Giardia muris]|uniref:Putative RAD50 DNA repair protein n=1 Tax=Giardia muris TaxID=5742 RepID=A0A4Z1T2H4_GIAMU|nr:putative RAD50 DNA repair protein [Giardia muris]|eukprot:TNJ26789.1 putative RAD50 DNA repair protein [Giardia muris]
MYYLGRLRVQNVRSYREASEAIRFARHLTIIQGENGSGKSTLAEALLNLLKTTPITGPLIDESRTDQFKVYLECTLHTETPTTTLPSKVTITKSKDYSPTRSTSFRTDWKPSIQEMKDLVVQKAGLLDKCLVCPVSSTLWMFDQPAKMADSLDAILQTQQMSSVIDHIKRPNVQEELQLYEDIQGTCKEKREELRQYAGKREEAQKKMEDFKRFAQFLNTQIQQYAQEIPRSLGNISQYGKPCISQSLLSSGCPSLLFRAHRALEHDIDNELWDELYDGWSRTLSPREKTLVATGVLQTVAATPDEVELFATLIERFLQCMDQKNEQLKESTRQTDREYRDALARHDPQCIRNFEQSLNALVQVLDDFASKSALTPPPCDGPIVSYHETVLAVVQLERRHSHVLHSVREALTQVLPEQAITWSLEDILTETASLFDQLREFQGQAHASVKQAQKDYETSRDAIPNCEDAIKQAEKELAQASHCFDMARDLNDRENKLQMARAECVTLEKTLELDLQAYDVEKEKVSGLKKEYQSLTAELDALKPIISELPSIKERMRHLTTFEFLPFLTLLADRTLPAHLLGTHDAKGIVDKLSRTLGSVTTAYQKLCKRIDGEIKGELGHSNKLCNMEGLERCFQTLVADAQYFDFDACLLQTKSLPESSSIYIAVQKLGDSLRAAIQQSQTAAGTMDKVVPILRGRFKAFVTEYRSSISPEVLEHAFLDFFDYCTKLKDTKVQDALDRQDTLWKSLLQVLIPIYLVETVTGHSIDTFLAELDEVSRVLQFFEKIDLPMKFSCLSQFITVQEIKAMDDGLFCLWMSNKAEKTFTISFLGRSWPLSLLFVDGPVFQEKAEAFLEGLRKYSMRLEETRSKYNIKVLERSLAEKHERCNAQALKLEELQASIVNQEKDLRELTEKFNASFQRPYHSANVSTYGQEVANATSQLKMLQDQHDRANQSLPQLERAYHTSNEAFQALEKYLPKDKDIRLALNEVETHRKQVCNRPTDAQLDRLHQEATMAKELSEKFESFYESFDELARCVIETTTLLRAVTNISTVILPSTDAVMQLDEYGALEESLARVRRLCSSICRQQECYLHDVEEPKKSALIPDHVLTDISTLCVNYDSLHKTLEGLILGLQAELSTRDERSKSDEDDYKRLLRDLARRHAKVIIEGGFSRLVSLIQRHINEHRMAVLAAVNTRLQALWTQCYSGANKETCDIQRVCLEPCKNEKNSVEVRAYYNGPAGIFSQPLRDTGSSGQKVMLSILLRIAISQVFNTRLSFIVLDEPTNYLDELNAMNLADMLATYVQSVQPLQLVVITHSYEFAERLKAHAGTVDAYHYVVRLTADGSVVQKQ